MRTIPSSREIASTGLMEIHNYFLAKRKDGLNKLKLQKVYDDDLCINVTMPSIQDVL